MNANERRLQNVASTSWLGISPFRGLNSHNKEDLQFLLSCFFSSSVYIFIVLCVLRFSLLFMCIINNFLFATGRRRRVFAITTPDVNIIGCWIDNNKNNDTIFLWGRRRNPFSLVPDDPLSITQQSLSRLPAFSSLVIAFLTQGIDPG